MVYTNDLDTKYTWKNISSSDTKDTWSKINSPGTKESWNEGNSPDVKDSKTPGPRIPVVCSKRWILAYIGMMGFFVIYSLRVNMSVGIVCMVKDDANKTSPGNNSISDSSCSLEASAEDEEQGEFQWDKTIQSFMLSSFFYGYMVMQVPGGWLAGRFGGRRVLGYSVFLTALATILLPEAARWDYRTVYALRVFMGVAQGVSFPCMHAMWGRWAPPLERTKLASFTYTGLNVGNIVTYTVSGWLCVEGFDHGWASIFYLTGALGFLWVILWFYLVADSPEMHGSISTAERDYILQSRPKGEVKRFTVPWLALFKSRALWVCLVAHMCNNWMHYTLLTSLPTFMKEVLKFDIKQNGVLSAVPYMVMVFTTLFAGYAADFLRKRYLSTTYTRRLFQSVSFLGSGACIVAVGFMDCTHRTYAVVLLAVAVGFEGLCYAGYMVNQVDFAPRYAGVLFGITNLLSTIPGILAPIVVGALTPNKTQEEWRTVFYICGALTVVGTLVFGGFASGELEPWAVPEVNVQVDGAVDDKPNKDQQQHDNPAFTEQGEGGPDMFASSQVNVTEKPQLQMDMPRL